MRLWSLHPQYLDSKGLVAAWRESLLAKQVLAGKTQGYIHHPQLFRFKNHPKPLVAINFYLFHLFQESQRRNYQFNEMKIDVFDHDLSKIKIQSGQIEYEFKHLRKKVHTRDPVLFDKLAQIKTIQPHPLFKIVPGEIESWEVN